MTDYDVALSFAGENRNYVDKVATELRKNGIKVFYDTFEELTLWRKDLYQYLSQVYKDRARYTVIFISKSYADKRWTNHELKNAQARAFKESSEYIRPARFDDTELPGLPETIAYISLKTRSPEDFARRSAPAAR
jgi:hypothetical protein